MYDGKRVGVIDLKDHIGAMSADMLDGVLKRRREDHDSILIKGVDKASEDESALLLEKLSSLSFKEVSVLVRAASLSDGMVERFSRARIGKAYIIVNEPLHGSGKKIHDKASRISRLVEDGVPVSVIIQITSRNCQRIPEITSSLPESHIDELLMRFPNVPMDADKTSPRYKDVKAEVDSIVNDDGRQYDVRLINFPYCVLETTDKTLGYHTHVFRSIFDNTKNLKKIGHCRLCRYGMICNGPDKGYVERFGEDEFEPIEGYKISPDMLMKENHNPDDGFTKSRLELNIGLACNNDCNFCISGKKLVGLDPPEKIMREIEKYKDKDIDLLNILGGEPTLMKRLPEVTGFAKKMGFKNIQIITNGRRLKDYPFTRSLIENGLNRISITIHGHNKEIQDSTVQREGAFDETIQGIKNVVRARKDTGIPVKLTSGICITKKNHRHLRETAEMIVNLGIEEILFINLNPMGNCEDNLEEVIPKYEDVRPRLKEAVKFCKDNGIHVAFDGFAHCITHGIADFQEEDFDQKDEVTSVDETDHEKRIQFDWIEERKSLKTKSEACMECILNYRCEGIWKEYVKLHGWSDFRPIRRGEG